MTSSIPQDPLLRAKLNLETAHFPWKELERYFAAGMVIVVSDELDLIEVATAIASDDKAAVLQWMNKQQLSKVPDDLAQAWSDSNALLWTVVVKPWILVQMRAS
ncbi:hypothetical protein SAMN06265795_101133 [Noviherbaspirillum humi]|uniref:DUF2288 domain-containing protein n=1 Tax=Noviherbaspirillum humi TaxID=1688639 RepID=A0A239BY74_9BURK|nr:DUF2288 domain-containing protein [Noviherbaspirillum humi]SNS12381.1 hypothetical protein SAMN06265795_101133 [Noviherbaspirillum humi]